MLIRTRRSHLQLLLTSWVALLVAGCGNDSGTPNNELVFEYAVPLDPESPWPKFRRNALQNGRSPVEPVDSGRDIWVFQTGKGIFSTPVIDGDSNVYIGSADRVFYALDRDGNERWSTLTGEVIDSSALLDDQGRLYFGSGDGVLYALDRETGDELWRYVADDASVNEAFISWFEGNVAIGLDGTLYVPNDNFCTYAIDRDTGEVDWCFLTSDQTWSLMALNPETGRLFMGNNYVFENAFAVDPATGEAIWSVMAGVGTVAASPMLASTEPDGLVVLGSFDGILRAFRQDTGDLVWSYGMRDHVYASPAQMPDGRIVQPSADGTIYALDPDGTLAWAYDTREPVRSSPAIDGDGNVYVGSGEGRLFVLNPDGTLRWSIRLIEERRNDLNASPALGKEFIAIAGENGGIFAVPYDYCLREELDDPRCEVGPGEALEDDGAFLVFTTSFGSLEVETPSQIVANQPLTLTLLVREEGDTRLAVIDSESVVVTADSAAPPIVDVSGDRRYLTLVPNEPWAGRSGGSLTVRVRGDYLVDLDRVGLRFRGGTVGGSFDQTFSFAIAAREPVRFPLPVPNAPGDDSGLLELYRLAAPLPTILPSYNQIGFDSIHYLIGIVGGSEDRMIAWGVGAFLDEAGRTVVDPASRVRFPLTLQWDAGLLTMLNDRGFTIEFNNFPIPFDFFRVASTIDSNASAITGPFLNAKTICAGIEFYGAFLEIGGFCNPVSGLLEAVGGAELRAHEGGVQAAPRGVGGVDIAQSGDSVVATFTDSTLIASEHNIGLLLIDSETENPVALNYTAGTTQTSGPGGLIATVELDVADVDLPAAMRAYVMVDAYPATVQVLP